MDSNHLDAISNFFCQLDGTLSESFEELSKPIKRRVPLYLFEQWHECLQSICNQQWGCHKVAEAGTEVTKDEVKKVFQSFCSAVIRSKLPQPLNPWTRAILIITAEAFTSCLSGLWDNGFLRLVLLNDEKADEYDEKADEYKLLADDLQRLYGEDAQNEIAGPLGFYCLARTMLLLPTVGEVFHSIPRHTAIDSYFHLLKNSLTGGTQLSPRTDLRRDRCYVHLSRIVQPAGELGPEANVIHAVDLVSPFDRFKLRLGIRKRGKPLSQDVSPARDSLSLPDSSHKLERGAPDAASSPSQGESGNSAKPRKESLDDGKEMIRILIIGDMGSGKTTIIDQLHKAVKQNVSFGEVLLSPSENIEEIRGRIKEGAKFPHQSTQDMVAYEGKIHLHRRNVNFQIVDSRGGLLDTSPPKANTDVRDWPALYRQAVMADLIILVIPADYFDPDQYNKQTLSFLRNYIQNVPDYKPQAMIAIAYSKCDEFGVTMKGNYRVIETPQDRATFETFRQAPSHEADNAWQSFLEEVAGSKQVRDDAVRLRRYLIDETRMLWETISSKRGLNHKFINGYFVAAQPVLTKKNDKARSNELRRDTPINWTARGFPLLLADFFYHIEHTRGTV